jgi:hypothetical protein
VLRSASRHSRVAAGFTLLEALIGLAIAGLGLVVIVQGAGTGLGSVGAAAGYVEAARRAQARLDTVGIVTPLAAGEAGGDDGDGFTWTTRVAIVAVQAPPRQGQGQGQTQQIQGMTLYRVDATETMPGRLGQRVVTLTTLRVGQGAAVAPRE